MFFDSSQIWWFSARSIVERLSQTMAIGVPGNAKSSRLVLSPKKCFAALESAMYSTSVVEVEMDFYFCDRHEIVDNPR
jgi:hypothetical protein